MPGGPHLIGRCAVIVPPDELASKAFSASAAYYSAFKKTAPV
jgi:hypothetical protein